MSSGLDIHPGDPPARGRCVLSGSWPSRIDRKQEVLDAVAAPLLGNGWVTEDDRHWLLLCLDEVVVNAMLHGNQGDPALPVEIALHLDDRAWHLTVCDRGEGFVVGDIPDADAPESLLLEHGRGIRIMREWLDRLAYYRDGACAVLSRRRADRPGPSSGATP